MLKPKNLEGVTVVLQPTQVKEDALSQVSQVDSSMNVETVVLLFAIGAIFGLVGLVAVDIMLTTQEAELKNVRRWHRIQCKQRKMLQTIVADNHFFCKVTPC